jgi:transcriptional regulator with XRE-family HTH domain
MGRAKHYRPARLAEKLFHIRRALDGGLSQDDMVRRLGMTEELNRNYISCFERGTRVPPLNVLLAYARVISATGAGEFLEALIDDELDLPERLPARMKSEGVKRVSKGKGARGRATARKQ